MTDRVRALLITDVGELLTIRRLRPGVEPYWVLPGGGVEPGEDYPTALARELMEELAATAEVHSLVAVIDRYGHRQHFYLARARTWSALAADRTGPEFTDPAQGEYHIEPVPLTVRALSAISLQPPQVADLIMECLSEGRDLFDLPDLRPRPPAGPPD